MSIWEREDDLQADARRQRSRKQMMSMLKQKDQIKANERR